MRRVSWGLAALCAGLVACGGGGGGSAGSSTPVPPDPDAMGTAAASRFLAQATFGPSMSEIIALGDRATFDAWFAAQRSATPSLEFAKVYATAPPDQFIPQEVRLDYWFRNAVRGPDQLRQRMAFALSEIMVVSDASGALDGRAAMLAAYYDILVRNALGDFRTLLKEVTLSQAMGHYLSMFQNQKPDPVAGIRSDENYAREVMQLFTVGLENLNLDGTGKGTPTYVQSDIENLARVFTGWSYPGAGAHFEYTTQEHPDLPMQVYTEFHDYTAKTIIGNTSIPAGNTPQQDLDQALNTLFNHPNVGPFIGRQLIQRLVTSNPSPAYVARVAAVFNDNGSGARGDLYAVARAILLDPEARHGQETNPQTFGKLREPLIRVTHLWRAFGGISRDGGNDYAFPEQDLGQAPLRSPSVFNFFRPRYQPTGALATAGLVAPEFQITNESTITSTTNVLGYFAGIYKANSGDTQHFYPSEQPSVDYRSWESRAADPAGLVADLDLVFLANQMPSAMRTALSNYIATVPANQPAQRVFDAVNLVLGSPQYAVQR